MPISTLASARDFEEKDHAEVEFVGFRYVGDQSTKTDHDIRQRVGYNGPAKFQAGRVYLALLPTLPRSEPRREQQHRRPRPGVAQRL